MASSNEAKRRFNDLVVESFLESMCFGEVVLRFLELNSAVRRDELAEKPEAFASQLEGLFGDGAKMVEERMIRNLYAKLGVEYAVEEKRPFSFSDCIKNARNVCLQEKK